VVETAAAAIRDAGLANGRLAITGTSYMTAAAFNGLAAALPDAQLVPADRLVEELRIVKSPAEQKLIRKACELGNLTLETLIDHVVEGATEADAVAAAAQALIAGGGVLYDAACASGPWSHTYTHARLPSADSHRKFERGDLFHVDCYGTYAGYFFDFARSRCVGDQPTDPQRELLEATIEGVEAICAAIQPGMTGDDVYRIGEAWLNESPVVQSVPQEEPEMEGFPAVGHGIGLMWEGPWLMPGVETVIEPGMYLAVEILLGHATRGGAMFEHNGLVTDSGFEVLTTARKRWW
jgi:Xaa-Pro aminopeptidase